MSEQGMEQPDMEQLQSCQVSSDPIYVNAREKLAAVQALTDMAQRHAP